MTADQVKACVLAYMREHFPAAKWASVMIDTGAFGVPAELLVVIRPESLVPAGQSPAQQARTA